MEGGRAILSTIDERVVKLGFNNGQFEQGVSKSMSTLDKLEEKLQFKKSSKGLDGLQVAIDSVSFARLTTAIDGINSKLSMTGVAAATVVSKITSSIMSSVSKLEQMTIGQIATGGWTRAMNIENAKFAVEGLKGNWEELNKAIDYSVTGTAYGLDQAAKAASTFLASGVDYTTAIEKNGDTQITMMHKALRAISGVAAQTNSDFDSIANVFTTVAGQGRLMGEQLNTLAYRGLNAAATLGEQMGKTEAEIRDMVSKGQISFEDFAKAMDNAFGDHAKDANKTFTGAFSNMKAALSRFGAVFATPVIQKTNVFFIALTDRINEMKKAIANVTSNGKILEEHLEGHFAKMWQSLIDLSDTLVHKIDLTWFNNVADAADKATIKITSFLDKLNSFFKTQSKETADVSKKAYDLSSITKDELTLAQNVINGQYGTGQARVKALAEEAEKLGIDPTKIQEYVNAVSKYGYSFEKAGIQVKETGETVEETEEKVSKVDTIVENVYNAFKKVSDSLRTIKSIFVTLGDTISKYLEANFGGLGGIIEILTGNFEEIAIAISKFSKKILFGGRTYTILADAFMYVVRAALDVGAGIKNVIVWITEAISSTIDMWRKSGELDKVLSDLSATVHNLYYAFKNIGSIIGTILKTAIGSFLRVFSPSGITSGIRAFSENLYGLSERFKLTDKNVLALSNFFDFLFSTIQKVTIGIRTLKNMVLSWFSGVSKNEKTIENVNDSADKFRKTFTFLRTEGTKLIGVLVNLPFYIQDIVDRLDNSDGIKRLKTAIDNLVTSLKGMNEETEETENNGAIKNSKSAIEIFVDVIDFFADKMGALVERIPGWIENLTKFWDKVKEIANGIRDAFSSKDGGEVDGPEVTYNGPKLNEKSVTGKIKDFVDKFIGFVSGVFSKIDGSTIKGALGFLLLLRIMYNIFITGDRLAMMIDSIRSLPYKIGMFLERLGKAALNMSRSFWLISVTQIIKAIGESILMIAIAMSVIADISPDRLYEAAALIVIIVWLVSIVVKTAIKFSTTMAATAPAAMAAIPRAIAIAIILWGLGSALSKIIKAAATFVEAAKDASFTFGDAIKYAIGAGLVLLALVGVVAFISNVFGKIENGSSRFLPKGTRGALVTIGWVLIELAAAFAIVAYGMSMLSKQDISLGGVAVAVAVIAVMGYAVSKITSTIGTLGWLTSFSLLSYAAIILVFAGGIAAIIAAVAYMADKLTQANAPLSTVLPIFGAVIILVYVLTEGITKVMSSLVTLSGISIKAIITALVILLSMVAVIGAVGEALAIVITAMALTKTTDPNIIYAVIAGIVTVIGIILVGLKFIIDSSTKLMGSAGTIFAIAVFVFASAVAISILSSALTKILTQIQSMSDEDFSMAVLKLIGIVSSMILLIFALGVLGKYMATNAMIGQSLVLFAITMILFGIAVAIMSSALATVAESGASFKTLGVVALMLVVMLAIIAVVAIMQHFDSDFSSHMILAAAALIIMALALSIFATACQTIQGIDPVVLLGAAGAIIAIVVVLGLMAALLGKTGEGGVKVLAMFAVVFISIAASVLVVAIGLALMAVSVKSLAVGLAMLTPILDKFFELINKNKAAAIGFGILVVVMIIAIIVGLAKISNAINTILTAFFNFFSAIPDIISHGIKSISDGLLHASKNFSGATKLIVGSVVAGALLGFTDAIPTILSGLTKVLVQILDWLVDSLPVIVDRLIVVLITLLDSLRRAIQVHANEIAAAIFNLIYAILGIVVAVIDQILSASIGQAMGRTMYEKTIGKHLAGFQQYLADTADQNMAIAKAKDAYISGTNDAYEKWAETNGSIAEDLKTMNEEAEKTEKQASKTSGAMDKLKDKASGLFGGMDFTKGGSGFNVKDLFGGDTEGMDMQGMLTENLGMDTMDASSVLGDFNLDTANMMGDQNEMLSEMGYDGGFGYSEGLAGGIYEGQEDVMGATDANVDAQIYAIDDRQEDLKEAGRRSEDYVAEGIESRSGDIKRRSHSAIVQPLADPLWEFANAPITAQFGARPYGAMMGNGIMDGVETAMGAWLNGGYLTPGSAANLTYQAAQQMKEGFVGPKAMDINSPSKVTYGWGQNIIQGLTNGIANNENLAVTSMRDLSDAMIVSFRNPLDYVGKIASGEIAYDPSIRPVLDTSNIARGAYGINSMLNNQNVAISGFSGKLAADISSLDTTNGSMVSEIRALREDMNTMTERVTNLQIVMDGGQLVGAIAPTMDNALGRRNAMRRRGN